MTSRRRPTTNAACLYGAFLLSAILPVVSCSGRDNSGYRGPTPGRTTPTAVQAAPALPVMAPLPEGSVGEDTDGNAPGIPEVSGPIQRTASGLRYIDQQVGASAAMGIAAQTGQTVSVHYTGWLTDGTKFDSSVDRGTAFTFRLGMGEVIRGWDEGVAGMGLSGKRRLIIPPALGYGERGTPGIPPSSTLIFDVELLQVSN